MLPEKRAAMQPRVASSSLRGAADAVRVAGLGYAAAAALNQSACVRPEAGRREPNATAISATWEENWRADAAEGRYLECRLRGLLRSGEPVIHLQQQLLQAALRRSDCRLRRIAFADSEGDQQQQQVTLDMFLDPQERVGSALLRTAAALLKTHQGQLHCRGSGKIVDGVLLVHEAAASADIEEVLHGMGMRVRGIEFVRQEVFDLDVDGSLVEVCLLWRFRDKEEVEETFPGHIMVEIVASEALVGEQGQQLSGMRCIDALRSRLHQVAAACGSLVHFNPIRAAEAH